MSYTASTFDGMPFFVDTDTGASFNCEGYMFVCSLRDGGAKLVVHAPDSGLAYHIESCLMDPAKSMAWALRVASDVDCAVNMAGADGQIHGGGIRKGYVCEK